MKRKLIAAILMLLWIFIMSIDDVGAYQSDSERICRKINTTRDRKAYYLNRDGFMKCMLEMDKIQMEKENSQKRNEMYQAVVEASEEYQDRGDWLRRQDWGQLKDRVRD